MDWFQRTIASGPPAPGAEPLPVIVIPEIVMPVELFTSAETCMLLVYLWATPELISVLGWIVVDPGAAPAIVRLVLPLTVKPVV